MVEAKWVLAKFAAAGILIGIILLFGIVKLNESDDAALGSRSAKSLSAENDVLRQQLNLMSPRVSKLEIQAGQLMERANAAKLCGTGC